MLRSGTNGTGRETALLTGALTGKPMHAAETISSGKAILNDNGGRRLGGERRLYSYNNHIPERRSGEERRSGQDRRKKLRFA